MKEKFTSWRPIGRSKELIIKINEVLEDYRSQGYVLTLRQLYYQLVSKDLIPNNVTMYQKIGNVVNRGRYAGLIDWSMIEDRVRRPVRNSHWDSPHDIVDSCANQFYMDHWEDQQNYVEVWCEKDAVSNILEPVCSKYDVVFMANRGYSSASAMYNASKRIDRAMRSGKNVKVIYFGDHDPSGIDMTRDIRDRQGLLIHGMGSFEYVDRAALNMDQVKKYGPPENPAKTTDSRFKAYVSEFGESSWELDALEPAVLSSMLDTQISELIDFDIWENTEERQTEGRSIIRSAAEIIENDDRW